MSSSTLAVFKPMRLACPWCAIPRHQEMIDKFGHSMFWHGLTPKQVWDLSVVVHAGLLSQVANIGRTWVLHDSPTQHDDMLYMEITSLSAN